jgi:predicted lipid-binding transport protein (Tim44 family)
MKISQIAGLVAGCLYALTAPAYAGPCTGEISRLQAAYDARLEAAAAAGPAGAESTAATMHRQPTPNSVAGAEVKLGDLPPAKVEAFGAAMKRAREADGAGDRAACEQALGEARGALGK